MVNDGDCFVESGEASIDLSDPLPTTASTETGMQGRAPDSILFELMPEDKAGPDDSEDSARRQTSCERKVGNTLMVAATMFMSVLLVTVVIATYQTRSGQAPEGIQQQKGAIQRDRDEVLATAREKQQTSGREVRLVPGAAALSSQETAGNKEVFMDPPGPEGDKSQAELEQQQLDQEQREAELRELLDRETAR